MSSQMLINHTADDLIWILNVCTGVTSGEILIQVLAGNRKYTYCGGIPIHTGY